MDVAMTDFTRNMLRETKIKSTSLVTDTFRKIKILIVWYKVDVGNIIIESMKALKF